MKPIVVWLRNDLRLDDHEPLRKAGIRAMGQVIPVYCLDPRHFRRTRYADLPKTGAHRARFLFEALADMRQSLQEEGADLVIRRGRPEDIIPAVAQEVGAGAVLWHREATDEELQVEAGVERGCAERGVATESFWGSTLFHIDDLPFPIDALDQVFTRFRKTVEKRARVRAPLDRVTHLKPLPGSLSPGALPTLRDVDLREPPDDPRASMARMVGGERAAQERLEAYFWRGDHLRNYKETRNGLLGASYSSKFSTWMALGNLSPRRIYAEVKRYEQARISNSSTYWMIFELLWRDYFRFLAVQHGTQLFKLAGFKHTRYRWRRDLKDFERWAQGRTGVPFVDANMQELNATGFMSNRGRQNVASFLAKDLEIDWRWGAAYFEAQLIDHDPASNWGNWQYVGGVGNDPRDRRFNILRQASRYDKRGKYVRNWLPQLASLPDTVVQNPAELSSKELRERYNIRLDADYPRPIINMKIYGR